MVNNNVDPDDTTTGRITMVKRNLEHCKEALRQRLTAGSTQLDAVKLVRDHYGYGLVIMREALHEISLEKKVHEATTLDELKLVVLELMKQQRK